MQLKNSTALRGGRTANRWYGSTNNIRATVDGGLAFRFSIPSKGGGDTEIKLTVVPEDLRALLKMVAAEHLELADSFAECTHLAIKQLRKAEKLGT
jgi:hypothetical protein